MVVTYLVIIHVLAISLVHSNIYHNSYQVEVPSYTDKLLLTERCDDASRYNNSLPYKTPAKFTTHLHRKRAWSEKNSPWPYFMLTQWTQALILLSADAPMYIPRSCSKTNFVMTGEDMLEGLDCQDPSWQLKMKRRGSKITFICS